MPHLTQLLGAVTNPDDVKLCEIELSKFKTEVTSHLDKFPKGNFYSLINEYLKSPKISKVKLFYCKYEVILQGSQTCYLNHVSLRYNYYNNVRISTNPGKSSELVFIA